MNNIHRQNMGTPQLFTYKKDGIYINCGRLKGSNLNLMYEEYPDETIDMLNDMLFEDILMRDKMIIKDVIKELKIY